MTPSRITFVLAWIVCALSWSACAATTPKAPRQPFHVAIIPVSGSTALEDLKGAEDSDVKLTLDTDRLSNSIRDALDGTCFTRATLLTPPADVSPADFDCWDAERRDAHWLAQAQAIDADLVLECDLAFAGKVVGESNEKFWLNLPLFLLGGPGCYFVGDRTYRGDARLRASLYELHALNDARATFGDGRSRLAQVESRFRDAAFDFLDRANGNVAQYAISIVVPAGLLATSGEGVERNLSTHVADHLASGLAREIALQGREIAGADRVAPIRIDPHVRAHTSSDGIVVTGAVVLSCGDLDRMEDFVLTCGSTVVRGEFDDGIVDEEHSTRRERALRYEFAACFPDTTRGDFVHVEVAAGGRSRVVRSFTLPVGELDRDANAPSSASIPRARTVLAAHVP